MNTSLKQTLDHLAALVAFDTQNPPRAIDRTGIFAYLSEHLTGFELTLDDLGDGSVNLLAKRGRPKTLFNFHIDTVPVSPAWNTDPFTLQVDSEHATGLGACDIKGAAACMLTAAACSQGDLALLFSSDEEAGSSRCIKQFLAGNHDYDHVIVAEPSGACAVLAHRGIATAQMTFDGVAGHASAERASDDSAIHRATRWAVRALDFAGEQKSKSYENLQGIRFNIGRIEGGIKPNMIAADTLVKFGVRTLPGQDGSKLLTDFRNLAEPHEVASFEPVFLAPSL
ncbi:MAG: acetylornithine deacetylase, partial [Gammaproteobacteria bacterium]|nr:acetylornithine deacetylase [Gammaproteobacteria bacterium]